MKQRTPWSWIPTLYFAQGIPYVVVMSVAVIMYKRLGISNSDIALYTSWLYLPWVIKPFWSPFVDILKSKRWWILTMQLLIGAGLAGVAFLIPAPFFFQATLAVLWLLAFSSATHDIAADGFYMLALDSGQQSFFVGIRSTFYRLAMIAGQGALIIFAGALESRTGLETVLLEVQAVESAPTVVMGDAVSWPETTTSDVQQFVMFPEVMQLSTSGMPADSVAFIEAFAAAHNSHCGFTQQGLNDSLYNKVCFDDFVHLGSHSVAPVGVVAIRLSAPSQQGEEVVIDFAIDRGDGGVIMTDGVRFLLSSWHLGFAALLV